MSWNNWGRSIKKSLLRNDEAAPHPSHRPEYLNNIDHAYVQQGYEFPPFYGQFVQAERLFHAGNRSAALPLLIQLVDSNLLDAGHQIAAAGMVGETYRGMGDFPKAEHFYRKSLHIASGIPTSQRPQNEWFRAWYPRVSLGLVMVQRRLFSKALLRANEDLLRLRDELAVYPIEDLGLQIKGLAALCDRQLGRPRESVERLKQVVQDFGLLTLPWYSFLWPDHFEALLMQSKFLCPYHDFRLEQEAMDLMDRKRAYPWSKAVAASVLIHMILKPYLCDLIPGRGALQSAAELGADEMPTINVLLSTMETAIEDESGESRLEGDPFLYSEFEVLRFAVRLARGDTRDVEETFSNLQEDLECAPNPLILLRAIEIPILLNTLAPSTEVAEPLLKGLIQMGCAAKAHMKPHLDEFSVPDWIQKKWDVALEGGVCGEGVSRIVWNDEPMQRLRMLAWP